VQDDKAGVENEFDDHIQENKEGGENEFNDHIQENKEGGDEGFDDHEEWSQFVIENKDFFSQFDE
jgi:hypothetical protein